MSTYEMLEKSIQAKKNRNAMNDEYINSTKDKLDVFFMNDRITQDEYNILTKMLDK